MGREEAKIFSKAHSSSSLCQEKAELSKCLRYCKYITLSVRECIGLVVGYIVPKATCSLPSRGAAVSKHPTNLILLSENTALKKAILLN